VCGRENSQPTAICFVQNEKKASGGAMATAKTRAQLRRLNDLSSILRANTSPASSPRTLGLQEIAALCAKRAPARVGRDFHAVRDELLAIACEWDLACDRLEDQSDVCLDAIATFLRR